MEIERLQSDLELIDQYIEDNNMTAEIEPVFGTRYVIHREGEGDPPTRGDLVDVHYIGQLLSGYEFDQSYDGTPFSFTLGEGRVIPGFELGIYNLHQSDSATFFIPSTYAYKDQNISDIPANSVLVFALELLSITPGF
jgi:FKBP-type peptidyl-prolyl cis-trans isomerase